MMSAMAEEGEQPLRTVGWGPFTLPGERERMRRLKEKYDRLADEFDREAVAATMDSGQAGLAEEVDQSSGGPRTVDVDPQAGGTRRRVFQGVTPRQPWQE